MPYLLAEADAHPTRGLPRRIAGAAAILSAIVLAGCSDSAQSGAGETQPASTAAAPAAPATAAKAPADAAGRLAANVERAGAVIDGDIERTLNALKGVPVVVKQWASWCPQCDQEFPYFQELAGTYKTKVAFVGLNARDSRADAEAYSAEKALKFPSIYDSDGAQSLAVGAGRSWPTTVFFDAKGNRTAVRPGAFASLEELDDYIRRYALNG